MKKIEKSKRLIFILILICSFFVVKTNVYAKEMTASEIPARSYVIGKYVFTREINEETGYNGALTTNLLMLASKSIESNDLKDMIVYYKLPSEDWIDGATGEELTAPEYFNVEYIDLQKEEQDVVVPVEEPAIPILKLVGPENLYYDKENKKEEIYYSLNIYLDAWEENTVKVDGVEIIKNDYNSNIIREDIKIDKFATWRIPESYNGNNLIKGRVYYDRTLAIYNTPSGYYNVSVRAYVEDEKGNRTYSDYAYVEATPEDNLPAVQIVNHYTEPKYIAETEDFYIYKLGIEEEYANRDIEGFAYIVYEQKDNYRRQVGIFELGEEFIVSVKKGNVVKFSAQLGYYDINGKFQHFMISDDKYYTIDARKLTAPIITYNPAAGYPGPSLSVDHIKQGEYISTNEDFYNEASEDSLDYLVEGTEIYRVYYESGTTDDSGQKPAYELIRDKIGTAHVFPPFGAAYYVARVYATNAEGKRVYSDFSEKVGVVRTPLLEASEVVDGKATITIKNIGDYGAGHVEFTLYKTGSDTKLDEITYYSSSQEVKFEIEVTEDMEVYAIASSHDYENSSGLNPTYIYSCNSNGIEFNIE